MTSTDETPVEMRELLAAIATLPETPSVLRGPLQRLAGTLQRKRRILQLVQDALSQIRLDMKYLMFDLEATRRERDEYLRLLDR